MAPAVPALGYAAHDSSGHLSPFSFERRATGRNDVAFRVTHCGICHSDLHEIRNEWNSAIYPIVPGHEVVGVVTEVGSGVTRFKVGDHVGVGCMVNSCGSCDACDKKLEQFCPKCIFTYNSVDVDGKPTYGGYSDLMVVDERFVLRVPEGLPLDATAPLLCAGITVYSPMVYFGLNEKGKKFGVVGLGGLGHMAVKFGKAFGLEVTVISTSPSKEKEAKELLNADHFLVSKDQNAMKAMLVTLYLWIYLSRGTNFGCTSGGPFISPIYDYDAPLEEYGNIKQPKWGHLKDLHQAIKLCEPALILQDPTRASLGSMQEVQELMVLS